MPASLASVLATEGVDVDTVSAESLQGRPDTEVWLAAQDAGRFLITQDLDFSDTRQYKPGTHSGVLIVRLANPSRRALRERIRNLFANEDVQTWQSCFVVATDRKLRIRRPDHNK